jgi:type II secretory ATPase GspE/PulE/Tfp pilus assembly ATPase PilB-like protein
MLKYIVYSTSTMALQFKDDLVKLIYNKASETEDDSLARQLSTTKKIPFIDLTTYAIEFGALGSIPEDVSRDTQLAGFHRAGRRLFVACTDPDNPKTKTQLEKMKNEGLILNLFITTHKGMRRAWSRYADMANGEAVESGVVSVNDKLIDEWIKVIKSVEDFKRESQKVLAEGKQSTTKVFEVILAGAYALGVSDIHIEPTDADVRVRMRLDGMLHDVMSIPLTAFHFFRSRLKILSGVRLNSDNKAQDGRFTIRIAGKEVEVRVSLIPGQYGESTVMRLLDPDNIKVDLEVLGYEPYLKKIVFDCIAKPNGIILLTGPTGSGKTTTLYAMLQKVYTEDMKIITIENPIEYKVKGLVQTQVDETSMGAGGNYTFGSAMRAVLRQDPDVIMVGEIRDAETADTAINAALTGHLVFSTLHTNTAAGAIPRLIGMGVNPKILGSSLTLSLAQRLVRKICEHCKTEYDATEDDKRVIDHVVAEFNESEAKKEFLKEFEGHDYYKLKKGLGCKECNGYGYKGRLAVHEGIYMNKGIEELAANNPSEREIQTEAGKQGFLTLREDAMLKILRGITTVEEAMKSVDMFGAEVGKQPDEGNDNFK